jgi:hypothetical protein
LPRVRSGQIDSARALVAPVRSALEDAQAPLAAEVKRLSGRAA